jgi:hypothetical protein
MSDDFWSLPFAVHVRVPNAELVRVAAMAEKASPGAWRCQADHDSVHFRFASAAARARFQLLALEFNPEIRRTDKGAAS